MSISAGLHLNVSALVHNHNLLSVHMHRVTLQRQRKTPLEQACTHTQKRERGVIFTFVCAFIQQQFHSTRGGSCQHPAELSEDEQNRRMQIDLTDLSLLSSCCIRLDSLLFSNIEILETASFSLLADTPVVSISKSCIALFSSYHIQKNLRKLDLWPWGHLLQLRGEKWCQLKPNHEIQDSEKELKNKSNKKVNRWFDYTKLVFILFFFLFEEKPSMYFIQEAFQRWTDQNKRT